MKVAFIQLESESLGVEYLSAALKNEGHETSLYYEPCLFSDSHVMVGRSGDFFSFTDHLIDRVIEDAPDLICFSVLTNNVRWSLDTASRIKKRRPIMTVFGGIHATSVPERLIRNPQVDAVCIGEGEEALVELADHLEREKPFHQIPNLHVKYKGTVHENPVRPLEENLDAIAYPDKSLYYDAFPFFQRVYTMVATRGCPYNCSYCNNNISRRLYKGKGRYLRQRSVGNVIEELRQAKKKWQLKSVDFHDDIFTVNREWIQDFCVRYKKEIALPFKCVAHVEYLDEALLRMLEDAGCRNMQVGIQTYNEEVRRTILNRHMSNETMEKALMPIQKTRIGLIADHIMGLPRDTEAWQVEAARFYNRIRPKVIYGFWLTCYPRTKIARYSLDEGMISPEDYEAMEEGNPKTIMTVGGKVQDRDTLRPFQFIFGYIPLLPRWLVNFLLNKRRYRFLPGSPLIATVLPRIIKSFFWRDIRAKLNMNRYKFFIPKLLRLRLAPASNSKGKMKDRP